MVIRTSQRRVRTSPYLGVYFRESRLDNTVASVIVADGVNYFFQNSENYDFILKDADGYLYKISITGDTGLEQLDIQDGEPPGSYTAKSFPISADGAFYEYAVDGYFRIKNNFFALDRHWIRSYNETIEIESPRVAANPAAGNLPLAGNYYMFQNNKFYLWDVAQLVWKYPIIVADALRQNAVIQLS